MIGAKPKVSTVASIVLGGRRVDYRVVTSKAARRLRVRVGPQGVEVVRPISREPQEVPEFLQANRRWIADQIERTQRLRDIRIENGGKGGVMLFRGEPTPVLARFDPRRRGPNRVQLEQGQIVVHCGPAAAEPAASLSRWLRREARRAIQNHLDVVTHRLKRHPRKVYVMSQRTKWGNCSGRQNLSFNWRLILAPDFVLQYLVTHEAVHLAVPDHSPRFWLLVQSLAPRMERAKQWLSAHSARLFVDLAEVCSHSLVGPIGTSSPIATTKSPPKSRGRLAS